MKFLTKIKKKTLKDSEKHRHPVCLYPKSCFPIRYTFGINKAGTCCGIIPDSNNLDCVRICTFFRHKGRLKHYSNFMTPDEALEAALCLIAVANEALLCCKDYDKYYRDLCKTRKNGDNHPAELNT